MFKRFGLALLFAGALLVGCGTEDAPEPVSPEPAATEDADAGGGGMMDDQDLDY